MVWDPYLQRDFASEEERIAAHNAARGRTLPQVIGGWWSGLEKGTPYDYMMANEMGANGPPLQRPPEPYGVSPYSYMLENDLGRTQSLETPQPVDIEGQPAPPPSDEGEREFMSPETWRKFVASGGEQMVITDPTTGRKTVIKNKVEKSAQQKALEQRQKEQGPGPVLQSMQSGAQYAAVSPQSQGQGAPPAKPGQQGPQRAPSGPPQPPPQQAPQQAGPPPVIPPTPPPPQAPGAGAAPPPPGGGIGGNPMDPTSLRLQAMNTPYTRRFQPGEEPFSPAEFEKRQRQLITERAADQERLLLEGSPEKAALLSRAYDRINKRNGTGMKVLLGVLSGNPFWVDTMAAYEADEEAKEARYTSDERRKISSTKYTELMSLLTGYEERLEKRKKEVAHELTRKLEETPGMIYNRDFNRDMAILMGTPAERVDQFLDDHYDPKTGEYNLILDPRKEALIKIRNDANVIKTLNPWMSDEVAVAAAKHPELWLKMITDSELRYETMARDPNRSKEEREEAARLVEDIRVAKARANDKGYIKVHELDRIRRTPEIWDNMKEDQKKKWGKDYLQALEEYYGASPGRDPEDVYLKRRLEAAQIQGQHLQNLHNEQVIRAGGKIGGAGKEEKEKKPKNIYESIAIQSYPVLAHGKPQPEQVTEAYRKQDILLMGMLEGYTFSGNTPDEKDARRRADIVRQHVWNYFTPPARNTFKELTYDEAAVLAQLIYKAHTDPEGFFNPPMDALYEFLRQYRAVKEQQPTKRKKFLGLL